MKKIITHIVILLLFQQVNVFSQYYSEFGSSFHNGLTWNPAYTGSRDALQIIMLRRNQWQGIEGSPKSFFFSADAPLKNDKVGLGLSIQTEGYGIHNNLRVQTYYSYSVPFYQGFLSFGVKLAFENISMKWNSISPLEYGDNSFNIANQSYFMPNSGIGFAYRSDNFNIAASLPSIFSIREAAGASSQFEFYNDTKLYNYFAMINYRLINSENFNLFPIYKIRYQSANNMIHDLGIQTNIIKNLWLGLNYRTANSFLTMIRIDVNKQLHLIYAYEQSISKLALLDANTHEISIQYEFSYIIKAVTPRF